MIAGIDVPLNGTRPVNSSYATIPSAYRSTLGPGGLAAYQLRGHVLGRSDQSRSGQSGRLEGSRDAEVDEREVIVVADDGVRRLHVSMDDPESVRSIEGGGELAQRPDRS